MTNKPTTARETPQCGWVKLYHPKGPLVTLPVVGEMEPIDTYQTMLANVSAMLDAGFLVQAPGLEEGEHKDEVGYLVKSYVGEDGTPAIDVYPASEAAHYSLMRVYLNTLEQQQAFEYACKVKLKDLPEYVGVGRLERGKSPQTDKLFTKLPKPVGIVWKDNPKYNPDETDATKKKPKRLFVRWADQMPKAEDKKEEPKEQTHIPADPKAETPKPAKPKKEPKPKPIVDPKLWMTAILGCDAGNLKDIFTNAVAAMREGGFSMDADSVPLKDLIQLKDDLKHLFSVLPVIESTEDVATLDSIKASSLGVIRNEAVKQRLRDALYARADALTEVPV